MKHPPTCSERLAQTIELQIRWLPSTSTTQLSRQQDARHQGWLLHRTRPLKTIMSVRMQPPLLSSRRPTRPWKHNAPVQRRRGSSVRCNRLLGVTASLAPEYNMGILLRRYVLDALVSQGSHIDSLEQSLSLT